MIIVSLSEHNFEYDIQSLIRAFYSKEEVKCILAEKLSEIAMEDVLFLVTVQFDPDELLISICGNSFLELQKKQYTRGLERIQYKNILKHMLYSMLAEQTGRTLPWGTLTGIRPTKLAMAQIEDGESGEAVKKYMRDIYLCSDEKIDLTMDIVKTERAMIAKTEDRRGYSIYIGIPFCPTRCAYCSFTSYSLQQYGNLTEAYLEALFIELDYGKTCFPDRELTTVYIGGGTPTTLSAVELKRLICKIKESFDCSSVLEFTVEAGRPDSITREKLMVLKEEGVTRISINPQTMNQRTLDIIGRKHTVEQITEAFHLAREIGHNNINMDLILGLPGEKEEDVIHTLHEINDLKPDSLTVHTLAVKRAADLNQNPRQYGDEELHSAENMMKTVMKYAAENELLPYYLYRQKNMTDNLENIGFAKLGYEGWYNVMIMEERQTILAFGAGASTKFVFPDGKRIERVENVKSVTDYIQRNHEMIERKRKFLVENIAYFSQ